MRSSSAMAGLANDIMTKKASTAAARARRRDGRRCILGILFNEAAVSTAVWETGRPQFADKRGRVAISQYGAGRNEHSLARYELRMELSTRQDRGFGTP